MSACTRWTWRCAMLLASLLLCAALSTPASAHAELSSSTPQVGSAIASAPSTIELLFTEAIDPGLSSMSLVAADGAPVPLEPIVLDPADPHIVRASLAHADALAPGVYTVIWGAWSAEDGHPSSGSFTFSAGTGEAPAQGGTGPTVVSTWAIAGKWLELIGLLLFIGLAAFALTAGATTRPLLGQQRRVVLVLVALALAGAMLSLRARETAVTGAAMLAKVDTGTVSDLYGSTYGHALLVRVIALIAALLATVLLPRRSSMLLAAILVVCGTIGLVSIAVSGHAGAVDPTWLAVAVDFVHMAAASIWLGGLLGLLLTLSPSADSDRDRALLDRQGNRFAVAIAIIVLAGLASAYWHIEGRRSLQQTDYGRTLLIKLAIVVAILGIAWYNRRVLQAKPGRPRWIPLAARAELILAMVVLLLSADLSQTPPANQPLVVQIAARALAISERAAAGASTVSLSGVLTDDPTDVLTVTVSPDTDLQRVIVHSTLTTDAGVNVGDRFDATPVEGQPGVYIFSAGRLGIAGPWRLEIAVRRAGVEDDIVTLPVDTSQLAIAGTRQESDQWGAFRITTHTALALALAVVMLVIGLAGLHRITGLEPLASAFLLAASLLIAGGFVISAARSLVPVTPDHALAAPVDTSAGAITYVAGLYQMNCAICHGTDGRGAGAANLAHLHGNAADLTGGSTTAQSDGDLFYWIANGVAGTRMPAFDQALTTEERWQLVAYIRQLQAEARAAEASE